MKVKLLTIASFLALTACKQPENTIVVTGDSWAAFVCQYKSLNNALISAGITNTEQNSTCAATTLVGVRADEWMSNSFHKATRAALLDKSVKALYLSIGGNDVLNYWNKNMTAAEENVVFDKVVRDIDAIVKNYQELRPDIKIIISGYDFPRFVENHPIPEYKEAFEEMGKPTPYELNSAVLRFSDRVSKLADQKSVFYIHHYGLMHYYRGNADVGLAAGRTLSPELISSPDDVNQVGGDVRLQSDSTTMFQVKVEGSAPITDAFHLNRFGYGKLAEHTVQHYLKDWFSPAHPAKK